MKLKVKDLEIGVRSELAVIGRCPEEGTPIHAEFFDVIVETADGRRWARGASYANREWLRDDEHEFGGFFAWVDGEQAANRLAKRIEAADQIDLTHWHEIDPCYGSAAYIAQDTETDQILRERAAG